MVPLVVFFGLRLSKITYLLYCCMSILDRFLTIQLVIKKGSYILNPNPKL